jgi:hypothetical protein
VVHTKILPFALESTHALPMIPVTRATNFLHSIQRLVSILATECVLCVVGNTFLFIMQEKVISQIAKLTTLHNLIPIIIILPTPVAARSEAGSGARSLTGIAGFEPRRRHGYMSLMRNLCWQVEVTLTGRSLVQRIPIKCVQSVIAKSESWGGLDPLGLSKRKKKVIILCWIWYR